MQGLSANTNQLTLSNKSYFNKGGLIQNYIDMGSVHEIEFSLVTNSVYNTLSLSQAVQRHGYQVGSVGGGEDCVSSPLETSHT